MTTSTLEDAHRRHRCGGFVRNLGLSEVPAILRGWNPLTVIAMILGFIFFWPIGLAIVAWNWTTHFSGWGKLSRRERRMMRLSSAPETGNTAFESWKQGELERLEEERRKLAAAQAEFSGFLDQLKQSKDREEFDRFMAGRTASNQA
jgi:hypothetical protein